MKTLNDKITFLTTFPASTVDETKTYVVKDADDTTIFLGTVFVPKSDEEQQIDIYLNDVLRSEVLKITILDSYNSNDYDFIKSYVVVLGEEENKTEPIFLGYDNMLHNYSTRNLLDIEQCETYNKQLAPMLQGINNYSYDKPQEQVLELYPHYPFVNTDKLNLSQMFNVGSAHEDIQYGVETDSDVYVAGAFTHNNYIDNLVAPLSTITGVTPITTEKKNIIVLSEILTKKKSTGTKLWRVSITGSIGILSNKQVLKFLTHFDYPDWFYASNFYIKVGIHYSIPIVVETNNPINDILGVFDQLEIGKIATLSYTEISLAYNAVMSYRARSNEPISGDLYGMVIKFFNELTRGYVTSSFVLSYWNVIPLLPMPDPLLIKFPFIVPDVMQLQQWQTNIENYEDSDGTTYEDFVVTDSGERATIDGKLNTYREINVPAPIKIAELDDCPAKYYLQWIDRYKGVQCQPFNGKSSASISYNIQNITNRYNEKRPASFENTYSFDINTGWLTDKEYPLFESIFVSPELKLYDTENDISYKVIVVDKQFVEKTYKNQKKMFGFNIKLAVNTTENILY